MATSSLVVQRERARRHRRTAKRTSSSRASTSNTHAVRRGFVFQDSQGGDNDHDDHDNHPMDVDDVPFTRTNSAKSTGSDTFVFRVKKPAHAVDVSTASAALQSKKERAQKAEERRQRILKQQREDAQEAAYAKQLENKLTPDQLWLYDIVRTQIKRELRKTSREFANSSARKDIVHLTEMSLKALKEEMVEFMIENPPADSMGHLPNPENARLRASIDSYEKRLKDFEDEERQWKAVMERIEGEASGDDDGDDVDQPSTSVACELPVTKEVEALQRQALNQIGTTAQKLELMDDSVQSIDRLILQIEMQKASLFRTFHDAAFKGYAHISQPKETLRALLKFAPPSASSSLSIAAAAPTQSTTATTSELAGAMTAAATAPVNGAASTTPETTEATALVATTEATRGASEDVEMTSDE